MKSFNLINIFESAVSQLNGLDNSQLLKDFVNQYKNTKIKGNFIIKPDDFSILMNKGASFDSFREDLLGDSKEQYSNSSAAGRLYNLYNNIKERTKDNSIDPARRKYYKDIEDEFTNLIKMGGGLNKKVEPENPVNQISVPSIVPTRVPKEKQIKLPSINDTKHLKDNNQVSYPPYKYAVNDKMLSVFKNIEDENVNMYYDAIVQGDDSLKVNINSPQGIVYALFKGLKEACNSTVGDFVELRSRMDKLMGRDSFSGGVRKEKQKIEKTFVDVDNLSLSRLIENSKIVIRYEILGEGNIFNGTFTLHYLRHSYELINQQDKNNYFILDKPIPLQGLIEVGSEYNVIYNSVSRTNEKLSIRILELKINSTEKNSDYDECSAVDELIKLVYNIRYGS